MADAPNTTGRKRLKISAAIIIVAVFVLFGYIHVQRAPNITIECWQSEDRRYHSNYNTEDHGRQRDGRKGVYARHHGQDKQNGFRTRQTLPPSNIISVDKNVQEKTDEDAVTMETKLAINQTASNQVTHDNVELPSLTVHGDQVTHGNVELPSLTIDVEGNTSCVKQFPKCLIIGVQKCGTKALAEFLSIHPQVAIDSKQTYYFSSNYSLGLDWYLKQLPCSGKDQITIERTPQYYYYKIVPDRVHDLYAGMKLILIVKNPVDRLVSNFAMAKYRHREPSGSDLDERLFYRNSTGTYIKERVKFIAKSRYAEYMATWLRTFPRQQLHIVDGEKFASNPAAELAKVESFLGLEPYITSKHFVYNSKSGFHCLRSNESIDCLPRTKGRAHPYVKTRSLKLLNAYFNIENERFFDLVNQRYDW